VHRDQQALKVQQDSKDVREYRGRQEYRDLKALQLLALKVQLVSKDQQDSKDVREFRDQQVLKDPKA
jgi:hypothetical protein